MCQLAIEIGEETCKTILDKLLDLLVISVSGMDRGALVVCAESNRQQQFGLDVDRDGGVGRL